MIKRILLQAGHGGTDPGAVANNTTENKEVNEILSLALPMLKSKGYNAVLMRDLGGNTHIITKHDVIQAVAHMGN